MPTHSKAVLITGCSSGIGAPSVRVMMAPHTLLPDRAWDAFLRTQFPQPGKE